MQCNGRGVVYVDSAESAESVIAHSTGKRFHSPDIDAQEDVEDETEKKLTDLPPEVEEKLHSFLYRFLGLNQIEFNLLWHLGHGGDLVDFTESMENLNNRIFNQFDHFDKRNCWAMYQKIKRVFKPLGAIAGGMIGHGKGGAVRKKRAVEQMDLFS